MLFNSLHFVYFFPIALILFFASRGTIRFGLIFVLSCYFYMVFRPIFILAILALVAIDYFAGILIEEEERASKRKAYLILSLVSNLAVLGVFKYYGFFEANVQSFLDVMGIRFDLPVLKLILPIGLSFHTFQSMSYTIEVYFGRQKAERSLLYYAVYVLYWPQLVAGPIERPQHLLPQFRNSDSVEFSSERVTRGLRLILIGFLKKVVIADRLAPYVNAVYDHPGRYSGLPLVVATYFFAFQIYCDFSGYSDIARGASRIMGIELMRNFDRPYCSTSVREFWKRWHISLSSWFRDYVFIPLGGSRCSRMKRYFNLMVVFLVSGFWHGANWTFLLWGFVHGLYICLEDLREWIGRILSLRFLPVGIRKGVGWFVTFNLVTLGWVFFRARNAEEAFYILRHALPVADKPWLGLSSVLSWTELMYCSLLIGTLMIFEILEPKVKWARLFAVSPRAIRWSFYLASVYTILLFGRFELTPFIYFQF